MSKRPFDTNQNKMSRNDRFAQMSQQEMLIEQKKREIQAKMEAKRRQTNQEPKEKVVKPPSTEPPPVSKNPSKSGINLFSNDGSFLTQFKQLNERKSNTKFKTFNKYKDKEREREKEKEKEGKNLEDDAELLTKEANIQQLGSNVQQVQPPLIIEPPTQPPPLLVTTTSVENPKFTFDATYPPPMPLNQFNQNIQINPTIDNHQNNTALLGPPPVTNPHSIPTLVGDFSTQSQLNFSSNNMNFTTAPPLAQINPNIPPPSVQMITSSVAMSNNIPPLIQQPIGIVAPPGSNLNNGPSTVNFSSTATSIQQQTQAIVTTTLAAPSHLFTSGAGAEQQIVSAPPQVLLNVPPPQILPQTQLVLTTSQDQNVLVSAPASILTTVTLPPPVIAPQNINGANSLNLRQGISTVELTTIPPPNPIQVQNIPQPEPINTMNIPPPAPLQVSNIPTPSSLQLNEIPNPKPIDLMAIPTPRGENHDNFTDANFIKNIPPPNKNIPPPNMTGQQGVPAPNTQTSRIPSLMSQRVLPPPGMGVNVPPPIISQPPPNFARQPPPPLPNLNVPPPMIGPPAVLPPLGGFKDERTGGAEFEAMANLARMVAECGPSVEDVVRQKKNSDPELWFLFHKESNAYRQYASLVDKYKREAKVKLEKPDPSEIYEPEMALEDDDTEPEFKSEDVDVKLELKQEDSSNKREAARRERKRKSRWGEKDTDVKPPVILPVMVPPIGTVVLPGSSSMLSKVTRTDPGLLQYAIQSYGSTNLTDEDWKKAEDSYKIHLLYQEMQRKREELERLQRQGRNKYEYDSDEDTEGGTWEHKLREKEMLATENWAIELNRQAEGKHHIGDFLPPEELKRFMEKSNAVKEGRQPNFSDYKEFKIKEDNIGFKMLQKLGWTEGQGLGQNSSGIVEPVNKGAPRESTQGLGLNSSDSADGEDEYASYRKRMMLAYRFRPNPLNNPRRPYY